MKAINIKTEYLKNPLCIDAIFDTGNTGACQCIFINITHIRGGTADQMCHIIAFWQGRR